MAPRKSGIYIAVQSGSWQAPNGRSYTFHKDVTLVRTGHPLLKGAGAFFEPVDDHVHFDVEHPAKTGETRKTPRQPRSAKPKAAATKSKGTKGTK
jgi:hypothetical protein